MEKENSEVELIWLFVSILCVTFYRWEDSSWLDCHKSQISIKYTNIIILCHDREKHERSGFEHRTSRSYYFSPSSLRSKDIFYHSTNNNNNN